MAPQVAPMHSMGRIGKCLHGPVSTWSVGQFEQISMPTSSFPNLPANVASTDQYYAYRICWAIINGVVEDDLLYLEVGPIVHSRWFPWDAEFCAITCLWMNHLRS